MPAVSVMMARWRHIALAALFVWAPAAAQDADTAALGQEADTAAAVGFHGEAVGFHRSLRGRALSDSLPAVRPEIDLVELLATQTGSFTYAFDRPGWPDGWSLFGLSPNTRPLAFNGIPFTYVFTGRPAHRLVPFAFIEPPGLEAVRFGRPYGVLTRLRPFVSAIPITEGTYWRDAEGLQSIDVVHAQHRQRPLFGRPGFLNVMGSYGGRATDVEYPGSDLKRGRRVLTRLRYEQHDWSIELLNMHNRRRIGAHHGVLPPGTDFNSIYRSDLADVERPEAERRILRNDLMAILRLRLISAGPSTVTGYWTAETFRYRDVSDTLSTASDRMGLHAEQPLAQSPRHRLELHVDAWSERVTPGAQFDVPERRRGRLHAYLRDTLEVGGWSAAAEAGWTLGDDGDGPTASMTLARRVGPVEWSGEISATRPPSAVLYETGFGSLAGLPVSEPGRIVAARTEATARRGGFTFTVGLFGHQAAAPVDVFASGDSAAVLQASSPFRRAGAYGEVGWRRDARRGFYAAIRPTATHLLDADRSALHRRSADALPNFFGHARVGGRYVIFQGDVDFDLYLEGTAWSGLSSRTLHPQTGLLIVPDASSLVLGASNVVNLVAEVRIRAAKVFLVYDNLLAGTSLLPGNLLVPVYPLPAQRFRFGLFWPIFG